MKLTMDDINRLRKRVPPEAQELIDELAGYMDEEEDYAAEEDAEGMDDPEDYDKEELDEDFEISPGIPMAKKKMKPKKSLFA